jgi:hypothetical protein
MTAGQNQSIVADFVPVLKIILIIPSQWPDRLHFKTTCHQTNLEWQSSNLFPILDANHGNEIDALCDNTYHLLMDNAGHTYDSYRGQPTSSLPIH